MGIFMDVVLIRNARKNKCVGQTDDNHGYAAHTLVRDSRNIQEYNFKRQSQERYSSRDL